MASQTPERPPPARSPDRDAHFSKNGYLQSSKGSVHLDFWLCLLDGVDGDDGLLKLVLGQLGLSLREPELLVGNHELLAQLRNLRVT